MNQLSKIMLQFEGNLKWEWPFLNETDLLLKYSMLMSFVVLIVIFIIQVLNRSWVRIWIWWIFKKDFDFCSVSIEFYMYTTVSTFLMFLLSALIWFKKLWDYFSPALESAPGNVNPPSNKFLHMIYNFSFYIMSSAIWRTLIYLQVVIILVTVSILHLVRD